MGVLTCINMKILYYYYFNMSVNIMLYLDYIFLDQISIFCHEEKNSSYETRIQHLSFRVLSDSSGSCVRKPWRTEML